MSCASEHPVVQQQQMQQQQQQITDWGQQVAEFQQLLQICSTGPSKTALAEKCLETFLTAFSSYAQKYYLDQSFIPQKAQELLYQYAVRRAQENTEMVLRLHPLGSGRKPKGGASDTASTGKTAVAMPPPPSAKSDYMLWPTENLRTFLMDEFPKLQLASRISARQLLLMVSHVLIFSEYDVTPPTTPPYGINKPDAVNNMVERLCKLPVKKKAATVTAVVTETIVNAPTILPPSETIATATVGSLFAPPCIENVAHASSDTQRMTAPLVPAAAAAKAAAPRKRALKKLSDSASVSTGRKATKRPAEDQEPTEAKLPAAKRAKKTATTGSTLPTTATTSLTAHYFSTKEDKVDTGAGILPLLAADDNDGDVFEEQERELYNRAVGRPSGDDGGLP